MRRVPGSIPAACAAALLLTSCGPADSAPPAAPPPAPVGVTARAGSATTVHVMWNQAPTGPRVARYEVYRGATEVAEVPGDEHMVDVTRLRPSTRYGFAVLARDAAGNPSPLSRRVTVSTPAAAVADRTPPSRPQRVRGRAEGSRAVALSWAPPEDDEGVTSYDVYQGAQRIHSVGGDRTTAVVTGLRPGRAYVFTVRARDAADNTSPAGRAVRLSTAPGRDDARDTAPTRFEAATHRDGGAYYVDLAWYAPQTDGVVTQYRIELDGRSITTLVWGGTPPRGRCTHSFYIGRQAGETHRVRIRALLPDGTWGAPSAERSVTTRAPHS
ncbi:fibronectin type III domain-containing protein [Streptomyces sp. NPDC002004]